MCNFEMNFFFLVMALSSMWIVYRFLSIFLEKKKTNIGGMGVWGVYLLQQILVEQYRGTASVWKLLSSVLLICMIAFTSFFWMRRFTVFIIALFHVVWALNEMIVFFCVNYLLPNKESQDLFGVLISKILMIVALYALSSYKKTRMAEKIQIRYYVLLLLVPLCTMYIAHVLFGVCRASIAPLSIIIVFCVLLFLNIVIFEIYDKLVKIMQLEKENAVYEQQIEGIIRNTENQKQMLENFHEIRHNWINELIGLKGSIELGDRDIIVNELDNLIKACQEQGEKIATGNVVVDAILNVKSELAKKNGIQINQKVFVPESISVNPRELGIVLGNALDNAIEATSKCLEHNRVIEIAIGIKKDALVIMIENPYEHVLKRNEKGDFLSTKVSNDLHGFGMRSMKRIVENYAGGVIVDCSEDIYRLTIYMCLPEV